MLYTPHDNSNLLSIQTHSKVHYVNSYITVAVGYLCYYTRVWGEGWVLITKISYDYCDITGLFPT